MRCLSDKDAADGPIVGLQDAEGTQAPPSDGIYAETQQEGPPTTTPDAEAPTTTDYVPPELNEA